MRGFLRAPTSGGQYHWVSEFAPRQYQKFLSYVMGWICVLGWQAACASTSYVAGTQIKGLIILNYPDTYSPQPWHGALLTMAVAAFSVVFNTAFVRKLPLFEGIMLVIHIWAFVGILVALWVLAPTADAKSVFTTFTDGGGWGNTGGSTLIGISSVVLPFFGADAAAHMSEELKDARKTVPQAMILTTVVNGLMGWVMVITFCFCIGDSLAEIIDSPTGYPFIEVFYKVTGTVGGATGMTIFIVVMNVAANLASVATASRLVWSL
jgi:choline transport protein